MAVLPIFTYNQPVLEKATAPVGEMTEEIRQLIDDMFETMEAASGVGLAANQVGHSYAITVIDIADPEDKKSDNSEDSAADEPEKDENEKPEKLVLINPVIEHFSEETEEFEEGCLSLPNFRELVVRPEKIRVRFQDASMQEQQMEVDGLLARVMQHEIDHLNGIYFFERLTPIRRAKAHNFLKRIQRGAEPVDYTIKPYKPPLRKKRKK